jgi:hypothetical protein
MAGNVDSAEQLTARSSQLNTLLAVVAGLCWAAALTLLLFGGLSAQSALLAPERLLFYALALGAALLTFAPIERAAGLSGLTVEGSVGVGLLLYCLAFVPAPSDWLLALPDLPVYGLLLTALLLSMAAISRPFIDALGRRIYQQRARAHDSRRVRRQSYEVGLLVTVAAALAGLRVLTWVSLLLLALALVIAELLFLSAIRAEPNQ